MTRMNHLMIPQRHVSTTHGAPIAGFDIFASECRNFSERNLSNVEQLTLRDLPIDHALSSFGGNDNTNFSDTPCILSINRVRTRTPPGNVSTDYSIITTTE